MGTGVGVGFGVEAGVGVALTRACELFVSERMTIATKDATTNDLAGLKRVQVGGFIFLLLDAM